jgi:hypothetical protein
MHSTKEPASIRPAGSLYPNTGPGGGASPTPVECAADESPPARRRPARGGRRRAAWGNAVSALDRKRLAAVQLKKAFGRIEADFSEAYEHCRSDTQRRALELAHKQAQIAYRRALREDALEDRDGWSHALGDFQPARAKAERALARLATAGAVLRILKRLNAVEAQLAALAA